MIAARFGHTAIRVIDQEQRTDIVYNWGLYDFTSPTFLFDFFRGHLNYTLGLMSMRQHLELYRSEERKMWQERINLTPTQKMQLMHIIADNAKPEHRRFVYDYWFQNCSTIPRDYIDQVVHKRVQQSYEQKNTHRHFRYYVRHYLRPFPMITAPLELIMTSRIDRDISLWEDMFLPMALRQHLLTMPAIDDHGRKIEGEFLLEDSQVLLDFPAHDGIYPGDVWIGLILLLMMTLVVAKKTYSPRVQDHRWLATAICGWGLIAGIFGSLITIGWFATGHVDLQNNANILLLYGGLDFGFLWLGWKLRKAEDITRFKNSAHGRWVMWILCTHLATAALALSLWLFGVIRQDLRFTVLFLGWPLLLMTIAYHRLPREPTTGQNEDS